MSKLLLPGLIAWVLIWPAHSVHAVPAVTGEVSFDAGTQLYTYTYTVDTRHLGGGTVIFDVLQNIAENFLQPQPVSMSGPAGFVATHLSVGGYKDPPISVYGSHWGWISTAYDTVYGAEPLVFSFVTERGVSNSTENNFYLWSGGYFAGPGDVFSQHVFGFGHVVGPQLVNIPQLVPEPASAALLPMGLLLLAMLRWRSSRSISANRGRRSGNSSKQACCSRWMPCRINS